MNRHDDDDVVISGIGGHFPESDNLEELRDNLFAGRDMVTSENVRWLPGSYGVPTRTGKMKSIEKFDAQYFGITRKQCDAMDPITRQVLERTYEAMVDAGLTPKELKGTRTCVYFSSTFSETEMLLAHIAINNGYSILGRNRSLNANRPSYWLDLKGTSCNIDCTWNDGIAALELAHREIKEGRADAAIVGCGTVAVHAPISKQFQDFNMLSDDGVTKAFDNAADGYARSEAIVIFIMQKAKDAKRSYGSIVHVKVQSLNHSDGCLQVPTKENWLKLYNDFYKECKVDPREVAFLEAEGMGIQASDIAEMNAAEQFFCEARPANAPLLVGSVKSNMGHAEASASSCSLAKAIIAFEEGKIPPNLHFKSPNVRIPGFFNGKLKVVTEAVPLKGDLLAINSLGLGSTYGHMLLRKTAKPKTTKVFTETEIPRLVLVSGRHEKGLNEVINKIVARPLDDEYLHLINHVSATSEHLYRGYAILSKNKPAIRENQVYQGMKRPVCFVFAGMGSQFAGMARDLMTLPVFRDTIEKCHNILEPKGLDLKHIITHVDNSLFDNILNNFVAITSVQVALVEVLRALDVEPDIIIGHSVGETAAAYADGCLTLEETILAVYYRGKVSLEVPVIRGMMAAIGRGYQQIKDYLPDGIQVACHNGPDSSTLSGPADEINDFVATLKSEGVFARSVNVANIAYHSKHIAKLGAPMLEYLRDLIPEPKKRSTKWLSTCYPKEEWDQKKAMYCTKEYLVHNLLSSVLFEEASREIPPNAITIEIAPHGLLQAILRRSLNENCTHIPLTNRTAPDQIVFLLQALGRMYMAGIPFEPKGLYPEVNYPVSAGTPGLANLATWDHSDIWTVIGHSLTLHGARYKEVDLHLDKYFEEEGAQVYFSHGRKTVHHSLYLMVVWDLFCGSKDKKPRELDVVFENVRFHEVVEVPGNGLLKIEITLQTGGHFEIMGSENLIVDGDISLLSPQDIRGVQQNVEIFEGVTMDNDDTYAELSQCGHSYSNALRQVKNVLMSDKTWKATVSQNGDVMGLLESLLQIIILTTKDSEYLQELSQIKRLVICPSKLSPPGTDASVGLDLSTNLITSPGIEIKDFELRKIAKAMLTVDDKDFNDKYVIVPTSDKSLKISYVEKFKNKPHLGFSGMNSTGVKIMGLGTAEEVSLKINPDKQLLWQVPSNWTTEEAATVPIAYSLAYHALVITSQLRSDQSILIMNGATPLGVACIAIAKKITPLVYVAVSNEDEKRLVVQRFKDLKENVKLLHDALSKFQCGSRDETRGAGFVVSTSTKHLSDLLYCAGAFSTVVQFFVDDLESQEQIIGTENFLKCMSFYAVSIEKILGSSSDEKKKLFEGIQQGIASGDVFPLPKKIARHEKELSPKRSTTVQILDVDPDPPFLKCKKYMCEPDKSYVIIGGEAYSWLHVTEWFVKRQAKHLTVIHSQSEISNYTKSRIRELKKISAITVEYVPGCVDTGIRQILKKLTNVGATIVLPMTDQERDLSYEVLKILDAVFQDKKTRIISIMQSTSKGVKLCSQRSLNGLPTLAVLWDNSQLNGKTRGFIGVLDTLLGHSTSTAITIKDAHEKKAAAATDADVLKETLPKGMRDLVRYSKTLPEDIRITELRTRSPGLETIKEILPLFLFPGVKRQEKLFSRFSNLLYPVLVVEVPHLKTKNLQEYAAYVIPSIKRKTPGPYILVGENWGGALAFEVGRQLECLGETVQLFLLSGTPYEILEPLKALGEEADDLEIGLVARLLDVSDMNTLQELSNIGDWFHKLNYCGALVKTDSRSDVLKGLDAIKCRLESLFNYKVGSPFQGKLTIVTKSNIPSWCLKQLGNETLEYVTLNADQEILNNDVIYMIHNTSLVKTIER